jgi:uncharacterized protein YndB with AHSA1/START domain/uncharacterized protein YciI
MRKSTFTWVAASASLLALGVAARGDEMTEAGHQSNPAGQVLEKEVVVDAPVADVWRIWTTTEGIKSTFVSQARIELHVGGAYEWYFIPDAPEGVRGTEGCKILSYLPMKMLSFSWNAPPSLPALRDSGAKTHVILEFEELNAGRTKVKMSQLGFGKGEAWDRYYAYFDRAWGNVLNELAKKFASQVVTKTDSGRKQRFIYFITPAREDFFDTGPRPEEEKLIGEHFEYLKGLLADGTLILAGCCVDPPAYPVGSKAVSLDMPAPGIVIFEADDEESARKTMEGDPAVREGVFKARVHPFGLALHKTD